jgi:hypothetical protein
MMKQSIYTDYNKDLRRRYGQHESILLARVIEPSKRNTAIPKGTLVVMPFVNGEVRLKIIGQDVVDKGFSIPLRISAGGCAKGLSPNYLLWYLKQDFVGRFLLSHVSGSVFPRIPKAVLFGINVPLPKYKRTYSDKTDVRMAKVKNHFRDMVNEYYQDYRSNFEKGQYRTATILAGAIAEAILYQLLLENDVDSSLLKNDRNMTMGKLLDYTRLLKLDKTFSLPLGEFSDLQKKRNRAAHIGAALSNDMPFGKEDLHCFDRIIKHFGV